MSKELKVIENDLVPVYETSTGEKVVYGSELHKVLEVKSPYREWSTRRFKDCDAIEEEDYSSVEISTLSGGTPKKEHIIKLDTAKEMAMLERNEKGKQVRRYFIKVEKKYKERTYSMTTTCQYPVTPAALESATNAGRLFERIMKREGVPPHEIAMAVRSIFLQAGIDIPEYVVKIPAYEQYTLDIVTR